MLWIMQIAKEAQQEVQQRLTLLYYTNTNTKVLFKKVGLGR